VTPCIAVNCNLVDRYQHFGEICCFHLQANSSQMMISTRAIQKVSIQFFEYLENWSHVLDVTWQTVRGDLIVHL